MRASVGQARAPPCSMPACRPRPSPAAGWCGRTWGDALHRRAVPYQRQPQAPAVLHAHHHPQAARVHGSQQRGGQQQQQAGQPVAAAAQQQQDQQRQVGPGRACDMWRGGLRGGRQAQAGSGGHHGERVGTCAARCPRTQAARPGQEGGWARTREAESQQGDAERAAHAAQQLHPQHGRAALLRRRHGEERAADGAAERALWGMAAAGGRRWVRVGEGGSLRQGARARAGRSCGHEPQGNAGLTGLVLTVCGVAPLHVVLPAPQALEVDMLLSACRGGMRAQGCSTVRGAAAPVWGRPCSHGHHATGCRGAPQWRPELWWALVGALTGTLARRDEIRGRILKMMEGWRRARVGEGYPSTQGGGGGWASATRCATYTRGGLWAACAPPAAHLLPADAAGARFGRLARARLDAGGAHGWLAGYPPLRAAEAGPAQLAPRVVE